MNEWTRIRCYGDQHYNGDYTVLDDDIDDDIERESED